MPSSPTGWWAIHQSGGRFKDGYARAFGSHQRPRHVKAVLRQQFIQIIAGNPPGYLGVTLTHQVGISVPEGLESGVNLAPSTTLLNDTFQFLFGRAAHAQAQPIMG